jgi:hypothetical protein
MYIQIRDGLQPGDPALEQKIMADPLMQQELAKQEFDLKLLATSRDIDASIVKRLRGGRASSLGIEMNA